jgi:LacI family transcriptional regulator
MIPVTIYDVARQAGVSIKTVSRVMNDEPKVGPVLRAKIKAIAEELGYSPNRSARSLAGSKSFVLSAFVDADLTLDHWGDERATDYLTRVQYGATLSCRKAGYHLVLQLIDHDPSMVRQQIQAVLGALKPDGVILTPPSSDNELVLAILRQSGTPFVRLGPERDLGGGLRIELDDSGAAAHMTHRLISLGHRRIGFVAGDPLFSSSRARLAGYRMAMAAAGLAMDPEWEQPGAYTYRSGHLAAKALLALSPRPTAIFASSDDMALGCLAAADEAGLTVPEELSIVGFDDSTVARFSRPRLTTMRQPLVAMARTAADALIRGAVTPTCDRTLALDLVDDFEFIERESSGPAPGVGRSGQRRAAAERASSGRAMKRSGPLEEEGVEG